MHDLFSLPQASEQDIQTIPMTETRDVLDAVLRFIYPIPDPTISSLDNLVNVLNAAVKYDLTSVIHSLRTQLVLPRFVAKEPSRVYAIATRYELEDEARIASKYTLNLQILDGPLSDDLKYITAYSYHRLLDLHRKRAKAAQALIKLPENFEFKCMQCNGSGYTGSAYAGFVPPKWWSVYEKTAKEELALRPTTDVIFGMEFLVKACDASGCSRCSESVLDAHKFLGALKQSIDALPDTI